jgi:tetratricopeptide (TPR) repeat protein
VLIDKVNEYILWGSNEEMIRKEEKDEEEEKNGIANHWLLVSIVQMKAEMNWRKGLKDEARNQMEQALMLAQEQGGLITKEAWICERLGEMAEEQGELDEAGIYLKQAIGLGTAWQQQQKGENIFTNDGGRITSSSWHHAMENAKILLRFEDWSE